MNLTPQGFWVPKAGSSETDYEDAFAVGPAGVAIADGATESSFARAWAKLLTEGFACNPLSMSPGPVEILERIGPLQQQWHEGIAWDRLPWFAEDKARNGAFAALLTLRFDGTLNEPEDVAAVERNWYALAIGDTCLVQIRADAIYLSFPIDRAAAFDSSPTLLSSNADRNRHVLDGAERLNGTFQPKDVLLLMTDALAKWFLGEAEAGNRPWHILEALTGEEQFSELVDRLRAERRLKNDDTTLLIIRETGVSHNSSVDANATDATVHSDLDTPDSTLLFNESYPDEEAV